jgi:nucleoside-diphosphate-sugar epimerase
MNVLVLGGSRNLGTFLVPRLVQAGHRVSVLNRGVTPDELPSGIERLRADRTDPAQLESALRGRTFDAVVDLTLYNGPEAQAIVEQLTGRVGHYIFISTGQVYLVREGVARPFREGDYEGPVMPEPAGKYDVDEWRYGIDKRAAEDVFAHAGRERGFPYTTLRLPMVNGERDHFFRLYGYMLRLKDGGPILIPKGPGLALRHVYSGDVVEAVVSILASGRGKRQAYNVSQDETVSLRAFLNDVAQRLNVPLRLAEIDSAVLEAEGLLADASPFSDRWMSELDNALGKRELGLQYMPLAMYLERTIARYESAPPPPPVGYQRRNVELALASQAR